MSSPEDDRIAANVAQWTKTNREFTDRDAERKWQDPQIFWGEFGTRDEWLGDVTGLDVVELGCGTAYFSGWLARLGARPVGVDLTPAQLETARSCQSTFAVDFPLVEASAENVPLPSSSFDLAVSEYGASVWCDPSRWVAEAARLLRPGGRLVFLTNSVLVSLCVPDAGGYAEERLLRSQRDLYRVTWPGGGVEFHPSHSDWLRVLRANGFTVEALHELYAPTGGTTPEWYEIVSREWADRWPAEDLWVARLIGEP